MLDSPADVPKAHAAILSAVAAGHLTADEAKPLSDLLAAYDITHDPTDGFDSYAFADMILKNQDHRLKYVISNRRIGSGPAGPQPGVWRKYTGTNPHDHHVHVSITSGKPADDTQPWMIGGMAAPAPTVVGSARRKSIVNCLHKSISSRWSVGRWLLESVHHQGNMTMASFPLVANRISRHIEG
jgi:hypothetical protein